MKYNKKELSKLNAQKEQTKEEMNHMLIASKEIDNFIQMPICENLERVFLFASVINCNIDKLDYILKKNNVELIDSIDTDKVKHVEDDGQNSHSRRLRVFGKPHAVHFNGTFFVHQDTAFPSTTRSLSPCMSFTFQRMFKIRSSDAMIASTSTK